MKMNLKKGLTKQMMSVKIYTYNPVLTDCFKESEGKYYEQTV